MSTLFAKGQDQLHELFAQAHSSIRYNNIYQRIMWDSRPTNEYVFDQIRGTIKYQTDNPNISAIARTEVLGSFNLDDKTFLWADKNMSIQSHLSDKVEQFRRSLPERYWKAKFISDVDFNKDLLALFSFRLNSNGFDIVRQENTILYFARMDITVFENEKVKYTIKAEPHFDLVSNENLINTIKLFHHEKVEVNDKYFNKKTLTDEKAFEAIQVVHLKYWLNEDNYYYPALSWPCNVDDKSTSDWQVVRSKNDGRLFVVYTADLGWDSEHYAYEIDRNAKGNKIIINEY